MMFDLELDNYGDCTVMYDMDHGEIEDFEVRDRWGNEIILTRNEREIVIDAIWHEEDWSED